MPLFGQSNSGIQSLLAGLGASTSPQNAAASSESSGFGLVLQSAVAGVEGSSAAGPGISGRSVFLSTAAGSLEGTLEGLPGLPQGDIQRLFPQWLAAGMDGEQLYQLVLGNTLPEASQSLPLDGVNLPAENPLLAPLGPQLSALGESEWSVSAHFPNLESLQELVVNISEMTGSESLADDTVADLDGAVTRVAGLISQALGRIAADAPEEMEALAQVSGLPPESLQILGDKTAVADSLHRILSAEADTAAELLGQFPQFNRPQALADVADDTAQQAIAAVEALLGTSQENSVAVDLTAVQASAPVDQALNHLLQPQLLDDSAVIDAPAVAGQTAFNEDQVLVDGQQLQESSVLPAVDVSEILESLDSVLAQLQSKTQSDPDMGDLRKGLVDLREQIRQTLRLDSIVDTPAPIAKLQSVISDLESQLGIGEETIDVIKPESLADLLQQMRAALEAGAEIPVPVTAAAPQPEILAGERNVISQGPVPLPNEGEIAERDALVEQLTVVAGHSLWQLMRQSLQSRMEAGESVDLPAADTALETETAQQEILLEPLPVDPLAMESEADVAGLQQASQALAAWLVDNKPRLRTPAPASAPGTGPAAVEASAVRQPLATSIGTESMPGQEAAKLLDGEPKTDLKPAATRAAPTNLQQILAETEVGARRSEREVDSVAAQFGKLAVAKGSSALGAGSTAAGSYAALSSAAGEARAVMNGYSASTAAPVTTSINTPVGSQAWPNQMAARVTWMVSQQINSAEIRLDPPDLGPLHVRISTQSEQTSVVFTSHSSLVRDAVDQSLPRLREMLEQQGLDLVDVDVSEQSSGQQQGSDEDGRDEGQAEADTRLAEADEAETGSTVSQSDNLVNIRV